MGGIGETLWFRTAKFVPFQHSRWRPSWNSSNNISQIVMRIKPKLDGRHRSDMEIQNCQNRFVPIYKMAWRWPSWKSSNLICSQMVSQIEPKLGGRHCATWRFRIAKTILFRYPRWHSSHLEHLQLLAHLELGSKTAYAVVCWPWSVPHLYVCQ